MSNTEMLHVLRDAVACHATEVVDLILDTLPPPSPDRSARLLLTLQRRQAGDNDPHVLAAHRLLMTLDPSLAPPLTRVHLASLAHRQAYAVCRPDGVIYIDPTSPYYRAAEAGDLLPLVALLVHEEHHARHGGDERAAYRAALDFLTTHGASPALIEDVERARAFATGDTP